MLFVIVFLLADSPIVITEVMSNVRGPEVSCGDRNEFVEIYNKSADTVDLIEYRIWDFDDAPPDEIWPWTNDSILVNYPTVSINSTLIYPHTYALILDSEYCSPDTTGGYWQPYAIPDSILVITTDETTICDGLTTTDPLILYSTVDFCTTSFGTPYDSFDNFPSDPGDGISWERIDMDLPDEISNWHSSIDTSGCTPGRENSVANAFDLAVDSQSIYLTPAIAATGDDVQIQVIVKNLGLSGTSDYLLNVFEDVNCDSVMNSGELVAELEGLWVNALDSTTLFYTYEHPAQGSHLLGFCIEYAPDVNPTNNLAFKTLGVIGEIGELALSPPVFTPDNDGMNDRLQIDYRLPESGGKLTVSIFDTRGIRIHDICRDEPWTSEQGTMYWDGRSSRGDLPIGMYIVYLEYQYHDKVTRAKKTTVLAR
ncbi:MAG: gliding motility-associated C-terminal domain-containing protein [candidate division WOR-3 bacterium]|nr:MAG: gliding motility-associated C-terminal domain-containing protein [candidate division WOR-3 bacterium]